MVRTECDHAVFPRHSKKVHTRNWFFDLKDKNYIQESKDERRARLDEIQGMTPLIF